MAVHRSFSASFHNVMNPNPHNFKGMEYIRISLSLFSIKHKLFWMVPPEQKISVQKIANDILFDSKNHSLFTAAGTQPQGIIVCFIAASAIFAFAVPNHFRFIRIARYCFLDPLKCRPYELQHFSAQICGLMTAGGGLSKASVIISFSPTRCKLYVI